MIKDISGVESKNNDEEIEEIIKIVDFNNVIEGKNEKFSKKLFKLGNKLKYIMIYLNIIIILIIVMKTII